MFIVYIHSACIYCVCVCLRIESCAETRGAIAVQCMSTAYIHSSCVCVVCVGEMRVCIENDGGNKAQRMSIVLQCVAVCCSVLQCVAVN